MLMLVERAEKWWERTLGQFSEVGRSCHLRDLAHRFPDIARENYRGFSRFPFISAPLDDEVRNLLVQSGGMDELLLFEEARLELARQQLVLDDPEDNPAIVPSVEALEVVCSLLPSDHPFEAVDVHECVPCGSPDAIGFDVGYTGPDWMSLLIEVFVAPRWTDGAGSPVAELRPFADALGRNCLFVEELVAREFLRYLALGGLIHPDDLNCCSVIEVRQGPR